MRTPRSKALSYTQHHFLALCLITGYLTPLQGAYAQQIEPQSATSQDAFQITAREQELRRKEEELLNAMRGLSDDATNTTSASAKPVANPSRQKSIENAITAAKVERDEVEVEANISVGEQGEQVIGDQHERLRALEQHPALVDKKLVGKKQDFTTPKTRSASVRSHENQSEYTGSRKLGSYTRVKREGRYDSDPILKTPRSHTVALQDISREASVRSVSLSQQEVATIQNGSTHLRTGPTRLDANVLSLPQFSEVAIDYRSGNWYRVTTTSGVRGWVPGTALLFDAGISNRSAVRVGAVRGKIR
jgi:hypothetical protein